MKQTITAIFFLLPMKCYSQVPLPYTACVPTSALGKAAEQVTTQPSPLGLSHRLANVIQDNPVPEGVSRGF